MNCKNCNAVMRVDQEKKVFVCPYCESVEPFDGVSKAELQGMLHDAIRDVRKESLKEAEKSLQNATVHRDNRSAGRKVLDVFITLGQIAFCVFLAIFSIGLFIDYQGVGFISLLQLGLMITAMITKSKYYRTGEAKWLKIKKICIVLTCVLVIFWIIALMNGGESGSSGSGKDTWPTQGLAKALPVPEGTLDYAFSDASSFSARVKKISREVYESYVEACKDEGFTVDAEESQDNYEAYDEDDNRLKLSYAEYSDVMYLEIRKAIEMIPFQWPASFGEYPAPEADSMCIFSSRTGNGTKSLEIYVGDVTKEQFLQYMQLCEEEGYECSYSESRNEFTGNKGENASIRVEFLRGRLMYIDIYDREK